MSSRNFGKPFLMAGAFAALLGTTACVGTTDFDRLRSQVYAQEQERKKQEERIAMLEGQLNQVQPMQSAQANSWAEINSMRSQLAALSGQMEDMRHAQSQTGGATLDSLNAKVQDLDRKTTFMATQLGVVFDEMPASAPTQSMTPMASSPGAASEPTQRPAVPSSNQSTGLAPVAPAGALQAATADPVPTGSGQELYQQALEGFYAKNYKQAQATWAEFVKGFPKDPLVPNAVFWQGECFFQMQDYANAVLTYQKVIEEHSKSNKFKAALLKQGIAFFKLKKDQAGKLVLEDLIKKYPDSAEAKRAQAYLKSGK